MSDFKSIGEILKGDPSKPGFHIGSPNGVSITVAPTQDPAVPGGTFVSVTDVGGKKRTIVYNSDGSIYKKA